MSPRPPAEPVTCPACGAEHPWPVDRCWVCRRGLPRAAAGAPVPAVHRRAAARRWSSVERPGRGKGPVLAGVLALAALSVTAPGLGILLLICGLPLVLASGDRGGALGCLYAALLTVGLLVAAGVAFFLTCSLFMRRDSYGDGGLLPALAVALALLVGGIVAGFRILRRRTNRLVEREERGWIRDVFDR